ncbi:MAG: PD40 domain-containing protein [Anaerolineae bacterium]|nr:PD40 domain-containing protein [Anaerolineae bacterium]
MLKKTCLLLGVVLLTVSGMIGLARRGTSSLALITFYNNAYNLYTIWPDGSHASPVNETGLQNRHVTYLPMQFDMLGPRVNQILQVMTNFHCVHERPLVSSTDQMLLFRAVQCSHDDLNGLYLMRSDGSQLQKLSAATEPIAAWSADGQWMVFRDGDSLYRIRANGSDLRQIADHLPIETPVWSPDGTWIAFHLCDDSRCGIPARIKPDGTQLEILSEVTLGHSSPPLWSPDGRWLVFMTLDGLYVIDLTRPSPAPERVSLPEAFPRPVASSLVWSGDWLYFLAGGAGNTVIYRLRPDETDPQPLTPDGYTPGVFRISPDGRWLVFIEKPSGSLYRMRPDGGDLQKIFHTERGIYYPLWSPVIEIPFRVLPLMGIGLLLIGLGRVRW